MIIEFYFFPQSGLIRLHLYFKFVDHSLFPYLELVYLHFLSLQKLIPFKFLSSQDLSLDSFLLILFHELEFVANLLGLIVSLIHCEQFLLGVQFFKERLRFDLHKFSLQFRIQFLHLIIVDLNQISLFLLVVFLSGVELVLPFLSENSLLVYPDLFVFSNFFIMSSLPQNALVFHNISL